MKYSTLIALTFAACFTAFQPMFAAPEKAEDIPTLNALHKIGEITVYRDRAMVNRPATLSIPAGKSSVVFTDLPNDLDPKSLRAQMGSKDLELLGISFERVVTNTINNDKLTALEKQRETLEAQIIELSDSATVIRHEQSLIATFQQRRLDAIAEQAADAPKSPVLFNEAGRWEKEIKTLDDRRNTLEASFNTITRQAETLNETLAKVRAELSKYAEATGGARITATVSVNAAKVLDKASVTLSYVTYSAGWRPAYDARLNQADNKIDFTYRGVIHQRTGEDWNGVSLKLSTAQPQISANPPRLTTLWLGGHAQGANVRQQVVTSEVVAQCNAMLEVPVALGASTVADFSDVEEKGPSVTFNITGTHSIPSGDQPGIVTIADGSYAGQWRYECVPAAKQGVYLKAQFKNASRYPVLAGRAAIYRNSGFIGNTELDFFAPEADVSFFAGNADGLSAVRTLVKQQTVKEGVIATDMVQYTTYGVTLLNNTDKEVTVRLRDAVPVSQVDEVKVKLVKGHKEFTDTTSGYTHDAKTGLIYWDVKIPANSKKTVHVTWSISNQNTK